MFDIEEITQKWYELGFLEKLPNHLKPVLAMKFELASLYIIDCDDLMGDNVIRSCIFPIIYRIYKSGKTINVAMTIFVREVNQFFINNRELTQSLRAYNNIDVDAEMCDLFCESYTSEKTMEPIKWITKHKFPKKL